MLFSKKTGRSSMLSSKEPRLYVQIFYSLWAISTLKTEGYASFGHQLAADIQC